METPGIIIVSVRSLKWFFYAVSDIKMFFLYSTGKYLADNWHSGVGWTVSGMLGCSFGTAKTLKMFLLKYSTQNLMYNIWCRISSVRSVGVCMWILVNILCVYDKTSGQMQYVDFFRWVLADLFHYCTFSLCPLQSNDSRVHTWSTPVSSVGFSLSCFNRL